jgi:hypothetical protein
VKWRSTPTKKKIGKSWFYFIFGDLQIPCLQLAPVHPTQ